MNEPQLLDLAFAALVDHLVDLGEPRYRAAQLWRAVYADLVTSYEAITTLPQGLRTKLEACLPWEALMCAQSHASADGRTTKVLWKLQDGETIESVLMRYDSRATACLSTQVGCAMGCQFCDTGQSGFRRNLSIGEIIGQALAHARTLRDEGRRLSNIVFMGMGEPMDNYDATLGTIRTMNDPKGMGIGARAFTLSTVGIIPGIRRLANESIQVNLAVSLHTADNQLRNSLVPANRTHPLPKLLDACRAYIEKTHRRVSFEVALIAGINDSIDHARQMAKSLRGMLCHVNLIPFNTIRKSAWKGSDVEQIHRFKSILSDAGIPTSVRQSRGEDIRAACGQLRRRDRTSY